MLGVGACSGVYQVLGANGLNGCAECCFDDVCKSFVDASASTSDSSSGFERSSGGDRRRSTGVWEYDSVEKMEYDSEVILRFLSENFRFCTLGK
ncbi:hypothetical protein HPP92_023785 [Vanilla planifolia]|uniref:Uncharacterized protein n=1 Tax=Vanilla planifolia TaxID=51239 RepID=A0A835PNN4_VANPL|nr:hypothetical protein HPP92_024139 [Vanilla planifolia]KAG0455997.1 hypothetical protein HPP92_023785 [Vanilla planifolia]